MRSLLTRATTGTDSTGWAVSPWGGPLQFPKEPITNPLDVAVAITTELADTTDLPSFDRKTVAYYTLATHDCLKFDAFPILELLGETNTGKNAVISAIRRYGYKAREPLVLRGTRIPILRDFLISTHGAVAIIDEADSMMDAADFEELLKCRSRKEQGQIVLNRAREDGKSYARESKNIYGPLVVHRQVSFQSPSLNTRCIVVHTHSNIDRTYSRPPKTHVNGSMHLSLEPFELDGVPRIADNWCPVASAAYHIGDTDFITEVMNKIAEEAADLIREAQAAEPTRLVLDGALALSFDSDGCWNMRRWKLSELAAWIQDNHQIRLSPRQVGSTLRHFNLHTVKSNGVYVASFSPVEMLKALNSAHATDDELYDKLHDLVHRSLQRPLKSTQKGASLWPQ